MTNEEMNIAVAEACGHLDRWVIMKRGLYYRPNSKGYTACIGSAWIVTESIADQHTYEHDEPVTKHRAPIPDYGSDLNAMHEAEKALTLEQSKDYTKLLRRSFLDRLSGEWCMLRSSAQERREAFLKTVRKWKD